jgi:predicted transposase YbfD/YdcC
LAGPATLILIEDARRALGSVLGAKTMARVTEAQRIENSNEEEALAFFDAILGDLPDPRCPQGVRYPRSSVLVIALMAMVCGCDDAEAFALWGDAHEDWLSEFLGLPHRAPSQDVFLSVFAALDPEAFSAVSRAWAQLLSLRLEGNEGGRRHIAVDGKTSRRSHDTAKGKPVVHTVSAWLCNAGLVLGQCRTREKPNEFKAIPELLDVLDFRGATVTTDAIASQTPIGGGNGLLVAKDTQPTLHRDLIETLAQAENARARSQDESWPGRCSSMSLERSTKATAVSRAGQQSAVVGLIG